MVSLVPVVVLVVDLVVVVGSGVSYDSGSSGGNKCCDVSYINDGNGGSGDSGDSWGSDVSSSNKTSSSDDSLGFSSSHRYKSRSRSRGVIRSSGEELVTFIVLIALIALE